MTVKEVMHAFWHSTSPYTLHAQGKMTGMLQTLSKKAWQNHALMKQLFLHHTSGCLTSLSLKGCVNAARPDVKLPPLKLPDMPADLLRERAAEPPAMSDAGARRLQRTGKASLEASAICSLRTRLVSGTVVAATLAAAAAPHTAACAVCMVPSST